MKPKKIDLRKRSDLYRVGRGEQGVLSVEPYKSEILPYWRFKDVEAAKNSAVNILKIFYRYRANNDFVGMDMARKFLQMGFTRARRYANHASGQKYSATGTVLPIEADAVKAKAASVFYQAWMRVENEQEYLELRRSHKDYFG